MADEGAVLDNAELAKVLFAPLSINEVTLANRIVMSPMAALAARPDGRPSEQTIAFLSERAKGGVGLIIQGASTATRRAYEEAQAKGGLRFDDDRFVPDLRRLTDAVHAYGTPIFVELAPGFGPMSKPSAAWPAIAASPKHVVMKAGPTGTGITLPSDRVTVMPREATAGEIRRLEIETAEAAARAQRAGYDGAEVAANMSYFLASFLSPRSNWRTDEYGGSTENRARVLVNIVRLVRERVGASFAVGLRISANDHIEGGQGPDGFAAVAQVVEREGLDYVAVVDGNYEALAGMDGDAPAVAHGEAQVFRKALSCPLILGAIHDPQRAAQVIAEGHADAVMLARPLLADPGYAAKIRDGRPGDIVRCDRNNECLRRLALGMSVQCTVNPRMGRESRPGPSLERLVRAPVEKAVLAAASSPQVMTLAAKLTRNKS